MIKIKKLIALAVGAGLGGLILVALLLMYISSTLPNLVTVQDYDPLVMSEVYDRNNKKIGEFFRERRTIVSYDQMPQKLVQAFVAAEDSTFFEHQGINYLAIIRAALANFKAGRKVQGGSTITQQTAKTLLLSSEKTYIRKIKDMLLAYKMEDNLSKEDILYLYLNQIYLGQGAYGVAEAAKVYFRKSLKDLTIPEAAMIAGLPQAPSRYSPIHRPERAKERQLYVLSRMADEGYITKEEAKKYGEEPLTVFIRKNYQEEAPYFLETVRQHLVRTLGEEQVLNKGLRIFTSIDIQYQKKAQDSLQNGLRELDKRQGYRGADKNITDAKEIAEFLLKTRNELIDEKNQKRIIFKDGTTDAPGALNLEVQKNQKNLPDYISTQKIIPAIVTKVDDEWGLVYVRFAETKGLIDLETMKWARKPNPEQTSDQAPVKKPSEALKIGDVIKIKVVGETFVSSRINESISQQQRKNKKFKKPDSLPNFKEYANVELEQDPIAEGALISFGVNSKHVLALVGGYDFNRNEFNRALQAARQTGSSFKPFVYAAGLDSGFTPSTMLVDAPVVYEEPVEGQGDVEEVKTWKPGNYDTKFGGDILFRTALIKSKNIPTIKILEKVGVQKTANYARRLGVFSPLNLDLSLGLGSSGVTLYEMTKSFSVFANSGRKFSPLFILKVTNTRGETLLENVTLDSRYENDLRLLDEKFETQRQEFLAADEESKKRYPKLFFEDPEQLISPQTAYLMNSILTAAIAEPGGTGGAARALGKIAAGKTGTTNGYFDTWFIGYTPFVSTGVWVGYDQEKTLGRGETGGRTALPIWVDYMQTATADTPSSPFEVPSDIVFVSIDNETGKLASASSKSVSRQAFKEGTEPSTNTENNLMTEPEERSDFFKEDLNE